MRSRRSISMARHVRFRDRGCRFGGLCARESTECRSGRKVALIEAGGAHTRRSMCARRLAGRSCGARRLDWGSRRSRSRTQISAGTSGRAARCSAGRAASTRWSTSAVIATTTTAGATSAIPAGATATCCRYSRSPRTTCAAPRSITAQVGRSRRRSSAPVRSATRSSSDRRACKVPVDRRLQRRRSGGRGHLSASPRARPAREHGACFLDPVRGRDNLTVITDTHAIGLVARRRSRHRRARARARQRTGDRRPRVIVAARRDRLAAPAAAVGHRPGERAARRRRR